jgi:hypothetical protein
MGYAAVSTTRQRISDAHQDYLETSESCNIESLIACRLFFISVL